MASERVVTENYLLTLASRVKNTRTIIVLVEEADGVFTHHRAKFNDESWLPAIGNIQALSYDILSGVSWKACNPDGTDIEEGEQ